jgi:HEAT repeat protein
MYFLQYERPADSAILFAEDAVRSAAAKELARIRSEEVYHVLLDATRQRATGGLVQALGAFRRHESVPLLFELLEDDLCRVDVLAELRNVPDAAQPYAILLLRGCTGTPIRGTISSRRRRSTLQLLVDFGISEGEWLEIRQYLHDEDLDCVIAAA